jgi:hypothetical protein
MALNFESDCDELTSCKVRTGPIVVPDSISELSEQDHLRVVGQDHTALAEPSCKVLGRIGTGGFVTFSERATENSACVSRADYRGFGLIGARSIAIVIGWWYHCVALWVFVSKSRPRRVAALAGFFLSSGRALCLPPPPSGVASAAAHGALGACADETVELAPVHQYAAAQRTVAAELAGGDQTAYRRL